MSKHGWFDLAAGRRIIMIDVRNLNGFRPLRGLDVFFFVPGPGVSLRFTPGFMLASAPRTPKLKA